ncbi:MAG: energy transducer TonB [Alphaproteobacteria bacterium]
MHFVLCLLGLFIAFPATSQASLEDELAGIAQSYAEQRYDQIIAAAPGLSERSEAQLGKNHSLTGIVLFYWGLAEVQAGDPKTARSVLRKAKNIFRKTGDDDLIPQVHIGLGDAHIRLGRSKDAMGAYDSARKSAKRIFGSRSPKYADILVYMVRLETGAEYPNLDWEQRALRKAKAYLDQVIAIRETAFGSNDRRTADAYRLMADVQFSLWRWGAGIDSLRAAVSIYEKASPPRYADAASVRQYLIWALQQDDQFTEASSIGQKRYPGLTAAPEAIVMPFPNCPANATRDSRAKLSFTVMPDGSLEDVQIVHANPESYGQSLASMAIDEWRFRPAYQDGEPTAHPAYEYEAGCHVDRDFMKMRQRAIGRAPTAAR